MPGSMLDLGKSRNDSGFLFYPQRPGKLGGIRRNIQISMIKDGEKEVRM